MGKPHPIELRTRVVAFVDEGHYQLAGYPNANMVSMVKSCAGKLALDRVSFTARALEVKPGYLMRLGLEQAIGRTGAAAVIEMFADPISENELGWVKAIREASNHSDTRLTSRSRGAINAIFGR